MWWRWGGGRRFYIVEKQLKVKWVSSVTVENGNDAWHEPKPPASMFGHIPPPPPRCPRRSGQAAKVPHKDQWWVSSCERDEREGERAKTFFRSGNIFHICFLSGWQVCFVFLKEPPPKKTNWYRFISFAHCYYTVINIFAHFFDTFWCVVTVKGMECVPARVCVCVQWGMCGDTAAVCGGVGRDLWPCLADSSADCTSVTPSGREKKTITCDWILETQL